MRYFRNIEQEATDFFKDMGLEDELEKMSDLFVENFMLQGEVTEDLKEILHRAPDSLVDMIGEHLLEDNFVIKAERIEKEELLLEYIPNSLNEQLIYMDPQSLQLLVRVAGQDPLKYAEMADIHDEFVKNGWVFMFIQDNGCNYVVSKEIKDVLYTLKTEKIKHEMEFIFIWRAVINTCLGLYGICKKEQIFELYKKVISADKNDAKLRWGEEHFDKLISIFEEQGMLWKDGNYIVSKYLRNAQEYSELLRTQNKNYYMPEDEVIAAFALGKMVVKDEAYKKIHKLLTKEIHDTEQADEMLEEISGYIVQEDWEIPQVMKCLQSWDVQFANEKVKEKFTNALVEWMYGIHRWSECGYSRKELQRENLDSKYIEHVNKKNVKSEKKIYPNDPCPCGSGKKYKKCCGIK